MAERCIVFIIVVSALVGHAEATESIETPHQSLSFVIFNYINY